MSEPRKVLQFQVTDATPTQAPAIFALCYDGTMWCAPLAGASQINWIKLPAIPLDDNLELRRFETKGWTT